MNRHIKFLALVAMVFFATNVHAEKQPVTDHEKFSYAVGVQVSQNLMRQSFAVEPESFIQAIDDVLNRNDLKLNTDEMQQVLVNFQHQELQKQGEVASANKAAGEKFLAENKSRAGIVTLPSGLQYRIVKDSDGVKPRADDTVLVHYEGTLIDGKVFDSSYRRGEPLPLRVDGVIKGWQEALALMPVGSKWQIFIPSELGYGERGAGADIGPNATLIFDIELISIE